MEHLCTHEILCSWVIGICFVQEWNCCHKIVELYSFGCFTAGICFGLHRKLLVTVWTSEQNLFIPHPIIPSRTLNKKPKHTGKDWYFHTPNIVHYRTCIFRGARPGTLFSISGPGLMGRGWRKETVFYQEKFRLFYTPITWILKTFDPLISLIKLIWKFLG